MSRLHSKSVLQIMVWASFVVPSNAFSRLLLPESRQTLLSTPLVKGVFDGLFSAASSEPKQSESKLVELKESLLNECRLKDSNTQRDKRSRIENIIEQLAPLSLTDATAASDLLQKNWLLEWTTEKEINFFIDWGISEDITQNIDGSTLENVIEFKRGGAFTVKGELSIPDMSGKRTEFKFLSANLDVGKWGSYNIPPVGAGWFDTVYLDSDLRVDCNSRDDILICTPARD